MNLIQAKEVVEALLHRFAPLMDRVDIVLWDASRCTDAVGVRVAEVSFMQGNPENSPYGGSTYFQNDPGSALVCYFAERAILARTEVDIGDDDYIDADYNLICEMFGREAADTLETGEGA